MIHRRGGDGDGDDKCGEGGPAKRTDAEIAIEIETRFGDADIGRNGYRTGEEVGRTH